MSKKTPSMCRKQLLSLLNGNLITDHALAPVWKNCLRPKWAPVELPNIFKDFFTNRAAQLIIGLNYGKIFTRATLIQCLKIILSTDQ